MNFYYEFPYEFYKFLFSEFSSYICSLALIKDICPLHRSSRFMSRNNNSIGSKTSGYSINPGVTEKLRPLHKMFFSHQSIHRKKN